MQVDKLIRPSVGARFIAPIADSSAFGVFYNIRIILLTGIIAPIADYDF